MLVELELGLRLELNPLVELVVEAAEEWDFLVPDCLRLDFLDCWELVEFRDCWELVEFLDCWELVEFQEIEAGEDPLLLVIGAEEDPQVRVALGVLGQLLSCCFRRLDTMVQVGTGRALLGRQQLR